MVSFKVESSKFKGSSGIFKYYLVAIVAFVLLLFSIQYAPRNSTYDLSASTLRSSLIPSFDYQENAERVKQLRKKFLMKCQSAMSKEDMVTIINHQTAGFTMPTNPLEPRHVGSTAVRSCRHVLMDFGANIGDSFGHLIDSGMKSCDDSTNLNILPPLSHFNIATKQFETVQQRNKLTDYFRNMMQKQDLDRGPEDYCYYGIEGNPHFTKRLQGIEDYVMSIHPRPIQHAHFFTESVGAGEDGMTKLYLDTVNVEQNFWGSSIFKEHYDVQQSAAGKDVETVGVPVMGYTIGRLMRMTLKVFDPNASGTDKKGSHLILKVDIEGGEYPLIKQAVADGTLCEFVKLGNTADLIIEFHSNDVLGGYSGGKHDYVGEAKQMVDTLRGCGVTFHDLGADWA
jgi:Methyltransferase FkbM domain